LLADAIHNGADALTAIPLLIAFRLGRRPPSRRFTYGYHRAEDLAGVAIVLMILGSAVAAGIEAARHLARPVRVDHVPPVLVAGVPGVEHVTEARARWVGHRMRAELSIDVDGTMSVEAGHDVAERVRRALLDDVPRLSDANVHVDPHAHGAH